MSENINEGHLRAKGFVEVEPGKWRKKVLPAGVVPVPTVAVVQPPLIAAPVGISKEQYKNEKELQNQIANYLRQHDIWFCRSGMHRKTSTPVGTPDFLFAYRGHPIALEVKMPGHYTTDEQRETLEKMKLNGWKIEVVHSVYEVQVILNFYPFEE